MKPPVTVPGTEYPILPRHGACLICRKRKQKCDATKPECYECVASNRKCQYEDETYRSRTQLLQDRIKELEAKIGAIEGREPSSSNALGSTSSSAQEYSSNTSGSPNPPPRTHHASTSNRTSSNSSPRTAESLFPNPRPSLSGSPGYTAPAPTLPKSQGPQPSPNVTKRLLEIFILRQAQCGFELHTDRVIANLLPEAPEPVIPALLSAMLLMACHFTEDHGLKSWEGTFLDSTKREIEDNITKAHGGEGRYNAVHHLQAMTMLAQYYYFKGRLLEGHFHSSAAARFAMTMGFHQLDSRIYRKSSLVKKVGSAFRSKRWKPHDAIELGEAINVWWICCNLDCGGSTLNGLPSSVSLTEITTVWPSPLEYFENPSSLSDDNYSVPALLNQGLSVAYVSHDNFKALLAKGCLLMECAARLDTERVANPQGSEDWWVRFEACDWAVGCFMQTMPPVNLGRNVEELAYLVLVHTSIYCATVQLHSALAEIEIRAGAQGDRSCIQPDGNLGGLSYARCTEACRAAALAAQLVADINLSYMHMFIGLAWVCVTEVLIREIPRLRRNGHLRQAQVKEEQLAVMERSMERLVATYPILRLQVDQVRSMKNW
ncbi:hypothetical protein BDV93DRAFT_519278 [Ceratobasidium sp. AG-I]|nr:hypothetical protein BDV93DRAFT_519278 [Ceratobasidium sp. AG-I]